MTIVYTLDVLPGHLDQLMDGSRSHVHRPPARWRPGDLVRLTDGERVAFLVVGLVSDPDPHLSRAHGTDPSLPAAASVRPAWASEIVAADQRQFLERAVQPPFEGVPHTRDAATCRRRWMLRLDLGRIVRKTVAGETYCWVAGQFPGGGSPSAALDPHGHLLARALKSQSIPPASWSGWVEVPR